MFFMHNFFTGKLLREVQQPDLMDKLIKATKDSDHQELQALSGLDSEVVEGDDDILEADIEEDEEVWIQISNFTSGFWQVYMHYIEETFLSLSLLS